MYIYCNSKIIIHYFVCDKEKRRYFQNIELIAFRKCKLMSTVLYQLYHSMFRNTCNLSDNALRHQNWVTLELIF